MSYTPTVWKKGDKITSEKLNKLENGVAGSGGGVLVVHANDGTLDKTWQEIHDAPFSVLTDETGTNWCTGASEDEGDYIVGYWTFGHSHPSTYIATTPNGYPALDSSD